MKIAGLIKQSLVDFPGEIAAVVFTQGCNLRCPFCHNGDLTIRPGKLVNEYLPEKEVFDFLEQRKGFLDALVISGGEPTLHSDLPVFINKVKDLGYLIKLDTNGTNSAMLESLLKDELIDYVAMDIKNTLEFKRYEEACGTISRQDFFNIRNSINLLLNANTNVEFRTTVVPTIHSLDDIESIAKYIKGAKLYSLQQFNPEVTLDINYGNIVPYDNEIMQELATRCASYVEKVRVVNI